MSQLTHKAANRRYAFEFLAVMGLYVGALIAVPHLIAATGAAGPVLYALALLPALPIAGVFVVMGRLLGAEDEYLRWRHARAMLAGGALLLSAVTGWDFLRVYVGAGPLPPFVVGPGFFAAFGLAQAVIVAFEAVQRRQAS